MMNILVPNLGSTSLKYQLLEMPGGRCLASGKLERVNDYAAAIAQIDTKGHAIHAVAFKAVHGGPRYQGTFLIDAAVERALEEFLPAAPAHNAIYLTGIRAFRQSLPDVPLVAAFETEFHARKPEHAARYGVPSAWQDAGGVRKYGFHGASHQFISEQVAVRRLISCHLGGSASICAILDGRSIDTTMGFSPQSGLENATRHGDLDVFAVLYMMQRHHWTVEEVTRQLATTGGLAGLSGISGGDVRDLIAAAQSGNLSAQLALDVFCYQVRKTIGAYAAALGGLDAVAFTGGIGENSAPLRAISCQGLDFLGIHLDPRRNQNPPADRRVSADGSPVLVYALPTNEERIVARRAYRALQEPETPPPNRIP